MGELDAGPALVRLAFVALAALAAAGSLRQPSRQRFDIAWMFATLAIPSLTGLVVDLGVAHEAWVEIVGSAALVLHPLALLRLASHLRPLPRWVRHATTLGTVLAVIVVVETRAAPDGVRQLALLAWFLTIEGYATVLLLDGALAGSGVRRARLLLGAAGALALLALVGLTSLTGAAAGSLRSVQLLLAVAIAVLYPLAFSPPASLLEMWQSVELQRFLGQAGSLPAEARGERLLDILPKTALDALGAVGTAIWRLEDGAFVLCGAAGQQALPPLTPTSAGVLADALARGEPVLRAPHGAGALAASELALLDQARAGSLLVAPILVDAQVWGVLVAALASDALFADAKRELIRVFCGQLALALQSRRQFEQQQALVEALRHTNADLEAASRHKSAFLANMSHELRTPLNAILGYSEILLEELHPQAEELHRNDLRKITSAGQHLLGLINSVLDLSKIEAGKTDVALAHVGLGEVVEGAVAAVLPAAQERGNEVQIEGVESLGSATTDPGLLRQILVNLLGNAAKFTEGGTISLRCRRERTPSGVWLCFDVVDTGIGMDEAQQARVFEAFTQADGAIARRYGGTGLGLSLSRAFAELLGGRLHLASEPGVGSTFSLRVPDRALRAQGGQSADDPAWAVDTVTEEIGPTVVLIEDDTDAADVFHHHLHGCGCRVVWERDGEAGLARIRRERPAAVLLDLQLPGMDGWTVLQELKGDPRLRDVPVLVVTVSDDSRRAFALGAADFLQKPVAAERLRERIERHVRPAQVARLLLVDDDDRTRELLARHLQQRGVDVFAARDGREGLVMLRQLRPDLVLLDLQMPVLDGFGFLLEKSRDPAIAEVPVIVLTARELGPSETHWLRQASERVLHKSAQPLIDVAEVVCARLQGGAAGWGARTVPSAVATSGAWRADEPKKP